MGRDWIVREWNDAPYDVLRRMLESGADIHACDAFGNSALHGAAMDAHQKLPLSDSGELVMEPTLAEDLARIFALLLEHGADPDRVEPILGRSLSDHHRTSLVGTFLTR